MVQGIETVTLDENQTRWKEKAIKSIKKYQQGALYLATGIGKSYVAKDIINDYILEDDCAQILWLAPASAMNNVRQNFFSTYENIVFESFENMRTQEDYVDNLLLDNLKLIVIDEAHKALATKTWLSIKYTLDKFTDRRTRKEYKRAKRNKADLLVLTASGVRSCDSIQVFNELTNRLEEHVDYEVIDLHEAIEQDLLGKIHFIRNSIGKYELMADTLIKQLSNSDLDESFYSKREEIQEIFDYITEYKSNMQSYLGRDIHEKIKNTYDGHEGDQWIVFYSRVKDAVNSVKFLKELFSEIYSHNENVKINVYQYHNAMTDAEISTVNSLMYSKPPADTVNVYVTVNKGITSIHPENVVGEIQFRSTYSQNLYEQSIGRVTKSKKHSNREVYVVDVADNADRVSKDGNNNKSSMQYIEDMERTEQNLVDKLKEDYLNNIDFQTINTKFDKIIQEFNALKSLSDISVKVNEISGILDKVAGERYKYKLNRSPYNILLNCKKLSRKEQILLSNTLKLLQEKFINGDFGRYTKADLENASPLYRMLFEKLGYVLFITPDTVTNLELYKTLIFMAKKVEAGTRGKVYKQSLRELQLSYIKGELPKAIIEFCRFSGINLKGNGDELIKLALDLGIVRSEYVLKTFNTLSKKLNKAENGDEQDLIKAYAMYYFVNARYGGALLMRAVNLTYDCIDKFNDILVGSSIKAWAEALEYIFKTDKLGEDEVEQLPKDKRHINIGKEDNDLVKLAVSIESSRKFTDFEAELLKYYGINVNAINKNIVADKVMNFTSYSNLLYRYEQEDRDPKERIAQLRQFKEVNINKLPSKWSSKIKGILEQLEPDTKEESVDTEELINACRDKISELEFNGELTPAEIGQIKQTYKKAQRAKVDEALIVSTCFPTIYIDHFVIAVKHMKENNMTFDDFLAVNGTIELGDEYISKLAFLLKFDLINSDYIDVSKKLINKQLEFV